VDSIQQYSLQQYLIETLEDPGVRVSPPAYLNAGWESDLYTFTLEAGPGGRQRAEWVLRLYNGEGATAKAQREAQALRHLHAAGYPVPRVLAVETAATPLGRPLLMMERIVGEQMWALFERSALERRKELLTLFCHLLVQLHALDWRPLAGGAGADMARDPYYFVDAWLRMARGRLENSPYPDFLPVIAWLEGQRDRMPCPRPAVVHQDFHPGNVLLCDGDGAVVIDWTAAEVTDPRFDLAWTLTLLNAYEGTAACAYILQEYERLSGRPVEHLAPFEVTACARRLFDITVSLLQGAEAQGMRPEAEAAMRQVEPLERVYRRLRELTGLRLARVETLLEQLGNAAGV
jgi:aminoglycoside phosphotransferase (APT) family kinase protein